MYQAWIYLVIPQFENINVKIFHLQLFRVSIFIFIYLNYIYSSCDVHKGNFIHTPFLYDK